MATKGQSDAVAPFREARTRKSKLKWIQLRRVCMETQDAVECRTVKFTVGIVDLTNHFAMLLQSKLSTATINGLHMNISPVRGPICF